MFAKLPHFILVLLPLLTVACASEPTLPTTVSTPTPTLMPAPMPTLTPGPERGQFAIQRTEAAPTLAAVPTFAPTVVAMKGQHEQWVLAATTPTDQQKVQFDLAGSRTVKDGKGQQYTCGYYLDGSQVSRANLAFPIELTYTVVENQHGELQGAVNAVTVVGGVVIPLEWRTWASRVDRIRLRDDHAARLVHEIRGRNAVEFELVLHDNPELSKVYDVSNLVDAIAVNDMTCFE